MRIISCHIENFGKLSDRTFSFEKGCNIYLQENGWGKSTLSAFIRVMFFGFEEEKSRDEYKNERRRYKPWQGGVYGGQLEFEASGERYIISRTFGTKQKDDSFSLRESETNLPSSRFSQNVGEELFQLDSHSFCRTVFVSQNDCETVTTDGINAKIGNLAEDVDDINNYEAVDRRLVDLLNKMSPRRVTGSLYKLKSECADLKEQARQYQLIKEKKENYDRAKSAYREITERLENYLSSLEFEPKEELQTQLMEIQRHLQNLQTCLEEYEKAARQKEEFEVKEDVETIRNARVPEGDESPEGINDRLVELTSELEKGYEYLTEYQRKLQELQSESDQAAECEERLKVRQEEYQADMRKYELIQKTRDLLEQAKISFTAKYTQPLRESFGSYYELFASQSAEAYRMDANNHVTVEEQGMQREPRFFSTGYRNLIGICMRMALVEAMYQEEKPFIIFDDPFADLDGEKLAGARRFLEKIGEEYQVLYFTCHESRV